MEYPDRAAQPQSRYDWRFSLSHTVQAKSSDRRASAIQKMALAAHYSISSSRRLSRYRTVGRSCTAGTSGTRQRTHARRIPRRPDDQRISRDTDQPRTLCGDWTMVGIYGTCSFRDRRGCPHCRDASPRRVLVLVCRSRLDVYFERRRRTTTGAVHIQFGGCSRVLGRRNAFVD